MEHDLGQRVPHPRGRRDGAAGTGLHAARRDRVRAVRRRRRASTWTSSCRASRSSSTRTATSSRRSRSTARRGSIWAHGDARPVRREGRAVAGSCASTRRRPACRSPRSSRTTTSCARRCRRWRRCSAARKSLHTNSLDEALALPTAEAATLALRTQQIIAHESGVTNVVDPLGGSYFVEKLTRDMEDGRAASTSTPSTAWAAWSRPSSTGSRSARSPRASYRFQQAVERKEKIIVGVNDFVAGGRDADPDPLHRRDRRRARRSARLARAAARRATTARRARARSTALRAAAQGAANTMPPLLDCVRAYATVGEMCDALRDVWGEYGSAVI